MSLNCQRLEIAFSGNDGCSSSSSCECTIVTLPEHLFPWMSREGGFPTVDVRFPLTPCYHPLCLLPVKPHLSCAVPVSWSPAVDHCCPAVVLMDIFVELICSVDLHVRSAFYTLEQWLRPLLSPCKQRSSLPAAAIPASSPSSNLPAFPPVPIPPPFEVAQFLYSSVFPNPPGFVSSTMAPRHSLYQPVSENMEDQSSYGSSRILPSSPADLLKY